MDEKERKMSKNTAKRKSETVVTEQPVEEVQAIQPIPVDDKGRKREVRMSMEELEQKGLKNKSQVIRYLIGENHSPSAVANFLGIKYQFVRNVMVQPLKRPAKSE